MLIFLFVWLFVLLWYLFCFVVLWLSKTYKLVSGINYGKFLGIILSNISSALLLLLFFWFSSFTLSVPFDDVPWFLDVLFCLIFPVFASFCFSVWEISIVKFTEMFLGHLESADGSLKEISTFVTVFCLFVSSISFWTFLRAFIYLLLLPTYFMYCLPSQLELNIKTN